MYYFFLTFKKNIYLNVGIKLTKNNQYKWLQSPRLEKHSFYNFIKFKRVKNLFIELYYRLSIFLNDLKNKLIYSNLDTQLLLLDIIDFLVTEGNNNHWLQISDKNFYRTILNLLRANNNEQIKYKILSLIKKWGISFQSKRKEIPNFSSIYENLRNNGILFPDNYTSSYDKYLGSVLYDNSNNQEDLIFDYSASLKELLMPMKFEKKYSKLVSYLKILVDNIALANDFIDNNSIEGVDDIIKSIKKGNNSLIKTIESNKINDENLMEITLGVCDDINKTKKRFENFKKKGQTEPFISYFIEKQEFFNNQRKKLMKSSLMMNTNIYETNKRQELINSFRPEPNVYNANNLFDIDEPNFSFENRDQNQFNNMNNDFSFGVENNKIFENDYMFNNNFQNPYLNNNNNNNNSNFENPYLNNNNFNDNNSNDKLFNNNNNNQNLFENPYMNQNFIEKDKSEIYKMSNIVFPNINQYENNEGNWN